MTLQPGLRFRAQAVVVQNGGGQWIYLPEALTAIPPYSAQTVVYTRGITNPQVLTTPPPGQQNTGSGAPATVQFTDAPLLPAGPVPYGQNLNPTAQLATDILITATNAVLPNQLAATSTVVLAAGRYRITAGAVLGFYVNQGSPVTTPGFFAGTLFYGSATVNLFGGGFGDSVYVPLALPAGGFPLLADGVTAFSVNAICYGDVTITTNTVTVQLLAHVVQETL